MDLLLSGRRKILKNGSYQVNLFIERVRKSSILGRSIYKSVDLFTSHVTCSVNISCQIIFTLTRLNPNDSFKGENNMANPF